MCVCVYIYIYIYMLRYYKYVQSIRYLLLKDIIYHLDNTVIDYLYDNV